MTKSGNNSLTPKAMSLPPIPLVDEETLKARAAVARAYALSDTKKQQSAIPKRSKSSSTAAAMFPIHHPQPQHHHQQHLPSHNSLHQHNKQQHTSHFVPNVHDEDYALFVKSLVDDDFFQSLPMDDEEFDFNLLPDEEEDDDDDDDEDNDDDDYGDDHDHPPDESTKRGPLNMQPIQIAKSHKNNNGNHNWRKHPNDDDDDDDDDEEPFTLERELGLLLEEDLEAAMTTLLTTNSNNLGSQNTTTHDIPSSTTNHVTSTSTTHPVTVMNPLESSLSTPTALANSSRSSTTPITSAQLARLQSLLKKHYQLLVQQAVLCVRAAQTSQLSPYKSHFSESKEDLVEILDGAVGMLQDLDQNRKDAIRTSIQLEQSYHPSSDIPQSGRLTRAAFTRTLQNSHGQTVFDIPGLNHLKHTFATLDEATTTEGIMGNTSSVSSPSAYEVCQSLLQDAAGPNYDPAWLPDAPNREYSELLSQPKEVFGPDFIPPCAPEQVAVLRRDRNQFTAAEDSLVFRGVNLYGEKQWLLIADRYLPDRSINIISQRYSKLSVMLYQAHGIQISKNGDLVVPPKTDSFEKIDAKAFAKLRKVDPPAILNVHRWSMEEDLMLLRAVPVLGHMWAELSTRLIPHRDRGHLRKRYQVLERRVKATILRMQKEQPRSHTKSTGNASTTKSHSTFSNNKPPVFLKKRGYNDGQESTVKNASPKKAPMIHANTPFPVSPQVLRYLDNGQKEEPEDSRLGFEKILEESDSWSHMSKVKHIMEQEPEGTSRSLSGVSRLASAAAAAAAVENLDQQYYHPPVPLIALSGPIETGTLDSKIIPLDASQIMQRKPILDSVLERSGTTLPPSKEIPVPSGVTNGASLSSTTRTTTPISSPLPRIELSPASYKGSLMSPSRPFPMFPNMDIGTSGVSALWGNDSMPSTVDAVADAYTFDTISERSRQALGVNTTALCSASELDKPHEDSTTQDLFHPSFLLDGGNSSTGFGGHEMDVVKALNDLSSSPARFNASLEASSKRQLRGEDNGNRKKAGSVKRSLFDQVIKGADDRTKKRKL